MALNREDIASRFKIGSTVDSVRSRFAVTEIGDLAVRVQPVDAKNSARLSYEKISVLVDNYRQISEAINDAGIERTVGAALTKAGLPESSTETKLWAFAVEFVNRTNRASAKSRLGNKHESMSSHHLISADGKNDNWTRKELRAAVEAYLDIQGKLQAGQEINKKQYYRDLSTRFGRSEKAFEYRMQNISYVLSLLGRAWARGLRPARNVGANVAAQIEEIFAEIENRTVSPEVEFETKVQGELKKRNLKKPSGVQIPKSFATATTRFERDSKVTAWILKTSKGKCECCKRPAPFSSPTGIPFLEVHHVRRLADGGSDTVGNAVALCPNCHKELHHGADSKKLAEGLYRTVPRLLKE